MISDKKRNIVRYKMLLNVLTPTHIGSGEKLSKLDYIHDKGRRKLTIIDKSKFISYLANENKLDDFVEEIEKLAPKQDFKNRLESQDINIDIFEFAKKKNLKLKTALFSLREYDDKNIISWKDKRKLNTVHLAVRDAFQKPYIPGSSIKGAIVTALIVNHISLTYNSKEVKELREEIRKEFNKLNQGRENLAYEYRNELKLYNQYKDSRISEKMIAEELFSKLSDLAEKRNETHENYSEKVSDAVKKFIGNILYVKLGNKRDISSERQGLKYENNDNDLKLFGVSVSDSYLVEKNIQTIILQDFDEYRSQSRGKYNPSQRPVYREYIKKDTEFTFDITLDFDMLRESNLKVINKEGEISSIKDIDDIIDLSNEKSAMKKMIKLLGKELNISKELKGNLILGGNTGFHQKTIMYALFEKENDKNDIIRALVHREEYKKDEKKDGETTYYKIKYAKIKDHIEDKLFPRVINKVFDGNYNLAGICQIVKVKNGSKELGR